MAIEVTFGVCGKETTQALFIDESDWNIPLSRLRKKIEEQSLYVPLEYKFLTLKNNAISHLAEETIVLKEIVCFSSNDNPKECAELKLEDFGLKSEIGEAVTKTLKCPRIWVTPLKVTFSSARPNQGTISSDANATDGEGESAGNFGTHGEDENTLGSDSNNGQQHSQGQSHMFCPYKAFKDFVHGKTGPPETKTILKVLFLLTFLLFTVLATLTLSLHLMLSSIMGIGKSPAMMEFLSKIGSGPIPSESSEAMTKLRMKMSQLETSSKYEIDQLTTRLAELEDLYLTDLAFHKKELNMMKKQMALATEEAEDEEMEHFEDNSRKYERSSNEPKKKTMGMKMSDRNKG